MRITRGRLTRHEGTLLSYQGPWPSSGVVGARGHERTGTGMTARIRPTRGQSQSEIVRPAVSVAVDFVATGP